MARRDTVPAGAAAGVGGGYRVPGVPAGGMTSEASPVAGIGTVTEPRTMAPSNRVPLIEPVSAALTAQAMTRACGAPPAEGRTYQSCAVLGPLIGELN